MRLLTAFTAAALVAGCATNPPSGPNDPQALGGAIAIDDVGYVRARVLRYLIAAKADLNARTPDRDTAVMLAALFRDEDRERNNVSTLRYDQAVRLLADAGANLENTEINAYTALGYAAYAGRENALLYLLQKGARANGAAQARVSYVNTPLMMAAMQGQRNAALHLLRAGADANVRVHNGLTALEFALKNKHTHLEKILRCGESLKPGETFRSRCE